MIRNTPQFRPPAEADSLILQIDEGCPYNACTFCGMYKGLPYHQRSLEDISRLIVREARHAPETHRIFLADGDVMSRSAEELRRILTELGQAFPELARVNLYATGRSIAAKSDAELRELKALRLHTLYLGLESGDEETLLRVKKGETAAAMAAACGRAQDAGLRVSVMVLLGLGGRERRDEHASATAVALNRMQPRLLSVLRVIPVPGTELHRQVERGSFMPVTEHQAVAELRAMVAKLELQNTVFRANHTSNVFPLEARFPRDKPRLLAELDHLLASNTLDTRSPGRTPMWL